MATELPSKSSDTSMGVKQSSSLTLAMYVCMYVFMYVCVYVCVTKLSYHLFHIHLPAVNTTARF